MGVMDTFPGASASPAALTPAPASVAKQAETAKFLNLAWYWWALIVVAIVVMFMVGVINSQ